MRVMKCWEFAVLILVAVAPSVAEACPDSQNACPKETKVVASPKNPDGDWTFGSYQSVDVNLKYAFRSCFGELRISYGPTRMTGRRYIHGNRAVREYPQADLTAGQLIGTSVRADVFLDDRRIGSIQDNMWHTSAMGGCFGSTWNPRLTAKDYVQSPSDWNRLTLRNITLTYATATDKRREEAHRQQTRGE